MGVLKERAVTRSYLQLPRDDQGVYVVMVREMGGGVGDW